MKKKIFAVLNVLLVIVVCLADYRYIQRGTLRLKGEASFCFVLLGAVNMIFALLCGTKKRYSAAILTGLILSMAGDVLLGSRFILGTALFAVGHVMYFAAHCLRMPFARRDWLAVAPVFAGALLLLTATDLFFFDPPVLLWVCVAYAAVISCMTGKALTNALRGRTFADAVMALGCVLFFYSDLMLVLEWFAGMDMGIQCLATYYPGQALLGVSPFLFINREIEK